MSKTQLDVKVVVVLIVVICLIVGAASYGMGVYSGINWTVNVGISFLKTKGVNINVDETMLKQAIFQYKNQIGGCYGTRIYNDTRA